MKRRTRVIIGEWVEKTHGAPMTPGRPTTSVKAREREVRERRLGERPHGGRREKPRAKGIKAKARAKEPRARARDSKERVLSAARLVIRHASALIPTHSKEFAAPVEIGVTRLRTARTEECTVLKTKSKKTKKERGT